MWRAKKKDAEKKQKNSSSFSSFLHHIFEALLSTEERSKGAAQIMYEAYAADVMPINKVQVLSLQPPICK